jgi:hypothetical protein
MPCCSTSRHPTCITVAMVTLVLWEKWRWIIFSFSEALCQLSVLKWKGVFITMVDETFYMDRDVFLRSTTRIGCSPSDIIPVSHNAGSTVWLLSPLCRGTKAFMHQTIPMLDFHLQQRKFNTMHIAWAALPSQKEGLWSRWVERGCASLIYIIYFPPSPTTSVQMVSSFTPWVKAVRRQGTSEFGYK